MNKIVFLTIIAMIAGAGSLQAQKKGGKTQPKAQTKVQTKVQPATERKPKTAEIDSLIALKQAKIEELKEYKKSVIYEYVTGKKEVV